MAKEIKFKITLYNPIELWKMFWNWTFWPRRQKCVEWCGFYDGILVCKVEEILGKEVELSNLCREEADRLCNLISEASGEAYKKTAELMSEPF